MSKSLDEASKELQEWEKQKRALEKRADQAFGIGPRVKNFKQQAQLFIKTHGKAISSYVEELMRYASYAARVSAQQSSDIYIRAEKLNELFQDMGKDPERFFAKNKGDAADLSRFLKDGHVDSPYFSKNKDCQKALCEAEIDFNQLFNHLPQVGHSRP